MIKQPVLNIIVDIQVIHLHKSSVQLIYQDTYLSYGFTYTRSESHDVPECVVCYRKLSNESMVPSK